MLRLSQPAADALVLRSLCCHSICKGPKPEKGPDEVPGLVAGRSTNEDGTDQWKLVPDAGRLIHIDIDPQEIGRNYEALRLQGDARAKR